MADDMDIEGLNWLGTRGFRLNDISLTQAVEAHNSELLLALLALGADPNSIVTRVPN